MVQLNPPFRADHIGSLKRPLYLLEKRAQWKDGKASEEELRAAEDKAIKDIVQLQREAGIKSFTDGEFRRHMFYDGVFDNLQGITHYPEAPDEKFMYYVPSVAAYKKTTGRKAEGYICEGKLVRSKPFYVDQFNFMKSITTPQEHGSIKITMCAPEWFHLRHGPHAYGKDVYANDEEYFRDIAKAYQEEIKELYALGCRNIQFDDPSLAYFCSQNMLDGMAKEGVDSEALLNLYCQVYNWCLEGRPRDMVVGVHLCRGNFKGSQHFAEGGYDRIAVKLFNEIDFDTYYLEYDTERAGTFDPLKFLPENKSVVLGLISSKVPELEDIQEIKKRVEHAAASISEGNPPRSKEAALNQICISPQCGFASHSEGNAVSDEDMKKKLVLVAEAARQTWSM